MSDRNHEPITAICRACDLRFEPAMWRVANKDFLCPECYRTHCRIYRARRKAAGHPYHLKKPHSPEWRRGYAAGYNQRSYVRERRIKKARESSKLPEARQKLRARYAVFVALRKGIIERGLCQKCGTKKVQAHHVNYSNPLEIIWLCSAHHGEIHAAERRGAR